MHTCTQLKKVRCTAKNLGAHNIFKPTILYKKKIVLTHSLNFHILVNTKWRLYLLVSILTALLPSNVFAKIGSICLFVVGNSIIVTIIHGKGMLLKNHAIMSLLINNVDISVDKCHCHMMHSLPRSFF